MIVYLAGGYLKPTGDALCEMKANRLFSYYDIEQNRVCMKQRFEDIIEIEKRRNEK